MQDLRAHLNASLHGRILWLGIGNPDYPYDQAGILLALYLRQYGLHNVLIPGAHPEHAITSTTLPNYDHVVFLDAVELGAAPGSVVFLTSHEIIARFPQISTHKISLGLLAQWVECQNHAHAWLLGIQPPTLPSQTSSSPLATRHSQLPTPHSQLVTRNSQIPHSVLLLGKLLVSCFANNIPSPIIHTPPSAHAISDPSAESQTPSSIFHLPSSSPNSDLLSQT